MEIPTDFRDAIYFGLQPDTEELLEEKSCQLRYSECPHNIFGILVKSAVELMPKWSRKKALRPTEYF
jgi:hypothetical protein